MEYNSIYFYFINTHVLADNNLSKTYILLGGGKTMRIGGQYYYCKLSSSGRNFDLLDFAIVHLAKETVEGLNRIGVSKHHAGFDWAHNYR